MYFYLYNKWKAVNEL